MSSVAGTYWCEWAWLGGEAAQPGVMVTVEATGRIASVASGVAASEAPPAAERLRGLVLPGFANAHSHAFHRALRARTHAGAGSFWTWRDVMYGVADRLDPDTYLALARATYAEMALAGITVVGEFHYLHHGPGGRPYSDPNVMGVALLAAAADAGIRITILDTCYLHGGIGTPPNAVQARFSDGNAAAWADRVAALAARPPSPSSRLGAAVHSVRAVDPASIAAVAAWAGARELPLHAHVSEQPAENDACLAAYDRTPTALLADAGALGASFTAVHATHLTDADIGLLGASGSTCCFCPTTERDLADGIGPSGRLASVGAPLALGSDSHAVIDPFEEARALELDERLATLRRGSHAVPALLTSATARGYDAVGWRDGGRVAPGALADLVVVALDTVRLAGAAGTGDGAVLLAAAVYAATASDVRHVMVGGRWIVRHGLHMSLEDVPGDLARAIEAVAT